MLLRTSALRQPTHLVDMIYHIIMDMLLLLTHTLRPAQRVYVTGVKGLLRELGFRTMRFSRKPGLERIRLG